MIFLRNTFFRDRPRLEAVEKIIGKGSINDIIDQLFYLFKDEYTKELFLISKIIENRKYLDERATKIASSLVMESSVKYVEDILNKAIELGRIAPLNTYLIGIYFSYIRFGLFHNLLLSPDKLEQLLETEKGLKDIVVTQIIDLKPPPL